MEQTTRQPDPTATVSNQPGWQLRVHGLLVSPLETGARLLQEHTPVLHLLQIVLEQGQALGFPASDRHCNRGTAAFWGEPMSDPRWKASHLLLCLPSHHIFPFPRSHLSIMLASRCSAFFLKLLQWQLSIQLGNKEIIPLGKPKCFLFLKTLTFPPRLAASEVLGDHQSHHREWWFPHLSEIVPWLSKQKGFLKHT